MSLDRPTTKGPVELLGGKLTGILKIFKQDDELETAGGSVISPTPLLTSHSRSGSAILEERSAPQTGGAGVVSVVADLLQMKFASVADRANEGGPSSSGATDAFPAANGVSPGPAGRAAPRSSAPVPQHRMDKFNKILDDPVIDLDALRELCWNGVPPSLRPVCWRLLMGYAPPNKARQLATLRRKRQEYQEMVPQFYEISNAERSEEELTALRQVVLDVPRTAPMVPFFHETAIQKSLERLLYIWGIRHPASGYVQGMNDLVTPFLAVFLGEHIPGPMEAWQAEELTEGMLLEVEADCYWCLCKLVEAIQDHYTYAQPGIQRTVFQIQEIVRSAAPSLAQRLEEENIDFIQFAWRWVNCLLIREVPFELSFRLWDTYLAEGHRFADFLVYACASFLVPWRDTLLPMEFQDMIMFLQKPPTQAWDEKDLEMVLGRAFVLRDQYTAAHLR